MLKPIITSIEADDGEQLIVYSFSNSSHPKQSFLFVHGIAGDSNAFLPLIRNLLKNIPQSEVIIYDQRGHGESSRLFPETEDSLIHILAKDLKSVIDQLEHKKNSLILLGQSLGGIVCQEYISQFHHHQLYLVLISSMTHVPLFSPKEYMYRILSKKSHFREAQSKIRTLKQHLKYKGSFDYSLRRMFSDIRFTGGIDYFLFWLGVFGWQNQQIEKINSNKTLLILSLNDRVVRTSERENLKKILNKAMIAEIDSNHNSVVNNPAAVGKQIAKWWEQLKV